MTCGGKTNPQDVPCGKNQECQGDAGKAKCVDKDAAKLGKCKCDNPGVAEKDKNGYKCEKDGKETKKDYCIDKKEACNDAPDETDPDHPGVHCDKSEVLKSACKGEHKECGRGMSECCEDMSCVMVDAKTGQVKSADNSKGKCEYGLPDPPSPPCAEGSFQDGRCGAVATAFGKLSTNPEEFIKDIFGVMLAMSGGIALLLIMKSGYLIMTAQGKPEALQAGRDQLIAAIVGLIFLIFSFVLLQTIGFEILKVPTNIK
jgi:hypothetical protein